MNGEQVKQDLDRDYRRNVATGALEILEGNDLPERQEILDLYPEILTQDVNGDGEIDGMSKRFQEREIEKKRREVQASLVGMRLGVEPNHLLELVKVLDRFEL